MDNENSVTINPGPKEALIKKYYRFLVDQYQYVYNGYFEGYYGFTSPKISIRVAFGHKVPQILITRIGEPEFTRLTLEGIVEYFTGSFPYENIDLQLKSLEENTRSSAEVLMEYADKITFAIDDWWLPAQRSIYEFMEKRYTDAGQLNDFLSSYKKFHDYLKSKGAI